VSTRYAISTHHIAVTFATPIFAMTMAHRIRPGMSRQFRAFALNVEDSMLMNRLPATPDEWNLDADDSSLCDIHLFGEANDIECNGVVTKCKACGDLEICEAHSTAGLCSQCVSEFVMRIKCQECGIGCLSDGMCACPMTEPLSLAALDVCLCLDGAAL
jgi:hypothetical protein